MLNIKRSAWWILIIRFLFTWFLLTILFSIYTYISSRLNYKYKFNENWRYELSYKYNDIFKTVSFGFFIFCLLYFMSLHIFQNALRKVRSRMIFSIFLTIILSIGFTSLWGNPFKNQSIFESVLVIVRFGLIGFFLCVIDYFVQQLFKPKNAKEIV